MNKICVYAICKNESKFVDRWADSMLEADSVVVLDTGSTDDTMEKLRARGIRVEQKIITPWRFDVARNESMKLIPDDCNILVCTDLDEILQPGWAKVLKDNWDDSKYDRCFYKYIWSHNDAGGPGRVFLYDKIHNRNYYWRFPVHETLTQIDTTVTERPINLFDKITLEHFPDNTKSRSSYLPLLKLRAEESPDDPYGLVYLAHEYYYRSYYKESIETLHKCLEISSIRNEQLMCASCYLFMGDAYMGLEDTSKAIGCYLEAIKIDKTYREPYLKLAEAYIKLEYYEEAILSIKHAIKNSYRHFSWLERDTSWTYMPYDLLCLAYYYSGDKAKALGYASVASKLDPTDERLSGNIKLCLDNISDQDILK